MRTPSTDRKLFDESCRSLGYQRRVPPVWDPVRQLQVLQMFTQCLTPTTDWRHLMLLNLQSSEKPSAKPSRSVNLTHHDWHARSASAGRSVVRLDEYRREYRRYRTLTHPGYRYLVSVGGGKQHRARPPQLPLSGQDHSARLPLFFATSPALHLPQKLVPTGYTKGGYIDTPAQNQGTVTTTHPP